MLTTGTPALDELLDGVRVGDNLVVLAGPGVPAEVVGRRFLEAAAASATALVVAATEDRAVEAAPEGALVIDHRDAGGDVDAVIGALAAADRDVGVGAAYLVDSLTAIQTRWGSTAALALFLATCPRLYRRDSVAMWLLDADAHDAAFLDRLCDITQVVVELRADDEGIEAEVITAAGRAPTVPGRRRRLRVEGGRLEAAGEVSSGRGRLGGVVRTQRTIRGLSQAELARRIGVSPSALSQVERGVRGLSAESLIRIWEVLGVPFGPEDTLQRGYRIARRGGHRELAPAEGVTGSELVDDPLVGRVWRLSVQPGASGRRPLFPGKATEVVLVLGGVLDLHVGGHPETLQEGDALVAADAVIESWHNPGGGVAELVWSALR